MNNYIVHTSYLQNLQFRTVGLASTDEVRRQHLLQQPLKSQRIQQSESYNIILLMVNKISILYYLFTYIKINTNVYFYLWRCIV